MLIITNGQAAEHALSLAGIRADILTWDDVLHDGPVPGGLDLSSLSRLRAAFLASCFRGSREEIANSFLTRNQRLTRFREHEEVLLWFEHDLYDQLQLIQVLDWFSRFEELRRPICLICHPEYVSKSSSSRLRELFSSRQALLPEHLVLAHTAWSAFRSPNPESIVKLLGLGLRPLPFLEPALKRLLQEYPHAGTGLSRSETQILRSLVDGPRDFQEIFRTVQGCEDPRYLGDYSVWLYIRNLATCSKPLLQTEDSSRADDLPTTPEPERAFLLTETGTTVLEGRADHVLLNGIDKWIGGVHLRPQYLWRWDPGQHKLQRSRTR